MIEITDYHPAMIGARAAIRDRRPFTLRVHGTMEAFFHAGRVCDGKWWATRLSGSPMEATAAELCEVVRRAVAAQSLDAPNVRAYARARCNTVTE